MARYIPRTLDFADTAPVRFEASEVVRSSPAEVWAVLCDHERWPEWMGSLKRVTPTSDPASGVGSTREVVLTGGLTFQEEFIAWDEGERWAFTGIEGPPVARGLVERVTLVPGDVGTRVTYRMAVEPRPGCGLLVRSARRGVERNLSQALRNLDDAVAARRP